MANLIVGLIVLACVVSIVRCDDYLTETEGDCKKNRDVFTCGKYTVLRYIDTTTHNTVIVANTSTPVQLVKIEDDGDDEESFFPEGRMMPGDGEFTKFVKFLQKRADRFLRTQGISVPLPTGLTIVNEGEAVVEGRGKHKKRGIISLLTLLGVFKLKLLLGLALLGIFFIKKVILLSALILPSILHNLKMSCKHAVPHISHHAEEYHDDSSLYGNYGHSGYSKEWERRYRPAVSGGAQVAQDMTG